jgi:hypothetical protein
LALARFFFEKSFNAGSVKASSNGSQAYAGGICSYTGGIGDADRYLSHIQDCFNRGNVSAVSAADGVASAGGISGYSSESASIDYTSVNINWYNIGNVSATNADNPSLAYAGGIFGSASNYRDLYAYYTYWNSDSSQTVNDVPQNPKKGVGDDTYTPTPATPLTTAQMKNKANFAGFDFAYVWDIDPAVNDGYPFLRAEGSVALTPPPSSGTRPPSNSGGSSSAGSPTPAPTTPSAAPP